MPDIRKSIIITSFFETFYRFTFNHMILTINFTTEINTILAIFFHKKASTKEKKIL